MIDNNIYDVDLVAIIKIALAKTPSLKLKVLPFMAHSVKLLVA